MVERGTAAAQPPADLAVAGKTGTAQNSHGKDHGWFIGFAPADKPELIVGAIMEFAEHGTTVAPYVVQTLRRYLLGPDTVGHHQDQGRCWTRPRAQDTAPRPVELDPDSARPRAEDSAADVGPRGRAAAGALRGPAIDRQLLMVSVGLIAVRPADAVFGGADRRAHPGGGGLAPAVHLGRHRRSWRRGSSSTSLPGCWSGWRPVLYGFSLSCWVVLLVGTGAGTAESSHSWLSIGGHQIGQPSELAKVATVLMLARYLSSRRSRRGRCAT